MKNKILIGAVTFAVFLAIAASLEIIMDAPKWGAASISAIIVQLWLIEDKIK